MRTRSLFAPVILLAGAALVLVGCGDANLVEMISSPWSLGCCGVVVVILDVLALIELAGSPRSTASKVLWAAIIIIFPYLGCFLYYFFGRD